MTTTPEQRADALDRAMSVLVKHGEVTAAAADVLHVADWLLGEHQSAAGPKPCPSRGGWTNEPCELDAGHDGHHVSTECTWQDNPTRREALAEMTRETAADGTADRITDFVNTRPIENPVTRANYDRIKTALDELRDITGQPDTATPADVVAYIRGHFAEATEVLGDRDYWAQEAGALQRTVDNWKARTDNAEAAKRDHVRILADVVEAAGWTRGTGQTLAKFVGAMRERGETAERLREAAATGTAQLRERLTAAETERDKLDDKADELDARVEVLSVMLRGMARRVGAQRKRIDKHGQRKAVFPRGALEPQPIGPVMAQIAQRVNAYNNRTDRR
ncbi:hypothetical protein [Saccharopolyspora taberi]|uniref:Uncharacterized protein n=1 Tax=Saccharopolyspora taberi TaxID=60895 RepID=A0ABN3V0D7_9PSEU